MIVVCISDPDLRAAVRLAARCEEDVVVDRDLAVAAVESGFSRLVLCGDSDGPAPQVLVGSARRPLTITLTGSMLDRWEADRHRSAAPLDRVEFLADRLRELLEDRASEVTWVDRVLADLGRVAGAPLPREFRGFARRILEFPSHYDDLYPLAEACGLSRGALKARFRRRGLASPYAYVRWLRLIASANFLADRSVTVAQAAYRMGYTSDGNLCRSMQALTGMVPTEVRTVRGWKRLLITFAWKHLGPEALRGWREMDALFERPAA